MTVARRTSIAIIGGGIGGLTAAALLLRAGFDVQVYEQARALSEVGAGINIGPNASRILHRLGIAEALHNTGVKPATFDQRRWDDGRILLRSPLGDAVVTTFGAPYYTFHRADLHGALASAVPADRVHLGYRFTGVMDHGDHVEAHFENETSISADALIGADGIHSAVAAGLVGSGKASLHRLRGVSRPSARGSVRASWSRAEDPDVDGAWAAFRPLLRVGGAPH